MKAKAKSTKPEPLIIERTFHAPVALVWKALTNKEDMKRWYFDLKEFKPEAGFEFQFVVEHEGMVYDHRCRVTEAIPNKKLAYTWRYADRPGDSLVTFELFADGDKTRLKLTHEGLESFPAQPAFARKNFMQGWTQLIGNSLLEFLSKELCEPFVISREFNAPRQVVWKAWTERERLMQWFGPKGFIMSTASLDFRPAGILHYCLRAADGKEMWGKFVYREIVAPEKIIWINSFSDKDGGLTRHPFSSMMWPLQMLSEATFTERNGKTTVTIKWLPFDATEEERRTFDGARDGITQGWTGTFEQLADYLSKSGGA
jgi:uncharacterized protein YndB with AHSA1/START domain